MKGIVNWKEIYNIVYAPSKVSNEHTTNWDNFADMYDKMAFLERYYTINQINVIPLNTTDTVLDVGCGPGRLTVPLAKRVSRVCALDSSSQMLQRCKTNVNLLNLDNVDFINIDWNEREFVDRTDKYDVVICSRSVGLKDLEKLSSYSRRIAAIIIWAASPSIPPILDRLFFGTEQVTELPQPVDRLLNYNVYFNILYDLGYDPNVNIVEDGFRNLFNSKEEAYEFIFSLRTVDSSEFDIVCKNIDKFLTQVEDGYLFEITTKSVVLWWDVNKASYHHIWGNGEEI